MQWLKVTSNCKMSQHQVYTVTYHHRWIVPLLVSACSIWVDAVIDDLERCQANSLHGAEVCVPEPASLYKNGTEVNSLYNV